MGRHEVAVIGAGVWGTAIARSLRRAGRDVVCLTCARPGFASPVAAGLVDPLWLEPERFARLAPSWWNFPRAMQDCLDFLHEGHSSGWAAPCGEYRLCPEPVAREGMWRVDVPIFLSRAEALELQVERLQRLPQGWRLGETLRAGTVVLACGWKTDELLLASGLAPVGVEPRSGRALLFSGTARFDRPLTLLQRSPGETRTRKLTALGWGEGVRVGDAAAQEPTEPLYRLAAIAGGSGLPRELHGNRPYLPRLFVEQVENGLIVATGGHRSGFASAAAVARRACELSTGEDRDGPPL